MTQKYDRAAGDEAIKTLIALDRVRDAAPDMLLALQCERDVQKALCLSPGVGRKAIMEPWLAVINQYAPPKDGIHTLHSSHTWIAFRELPDVLRIVALEKAETP